MAEILSVAGVTIGAASLSVQIFEGAKKGYRYFEQAANMPADCKSLQLELEIQHTRLLDWGDVAGLSSESDFATFDRTLQMNRGIIMALLSELKTLLKRMRQTSLEYGEPSRDSLRTANDGSHGRKEIVADIDLSKYRSIFNSSSISMERKKGHTGFNHIFKFGKDMKSVAKDPKQLKWAIRDREKFEKDLNKLGKLIDYLHETLGDHKKDVLLQATHEIKIAMVQMSETTGQIKQLLEAVKPLSPHNPGDSESSISDHTTIGEILDDQTLETTSRTRDSIFRNLAEFKIKVMEVDMLGTSSIFGPLRKDIADIDFVDSEESDIGLEDRSIGTFSQKPVWVEWKISEPTTTVPLDELRGHVRRLTALLNDPHLPLEFCVPRCLGYVEKPDQRKFGLIFRYPESGFQGGSRPQTLLDEFENKKPTLEERIQLSQKLATSLLYLHAGSWLHKELFSGNIIFFPSTDGVGSDLGSPYVSGFGVSRPDESGITVGPSNNPQWELYCHPDYLAEPKPQYRKSYDIYSLGIILLEIAHWKPASQIFNIPDPANTAVPDLTSISKNLLDGLDGNLGTLKQEMGGRFHEATRTCIEGLSAFKLDADIDQAKPIHGVLIQKAFSKLVVDVLNEITV